jgi:site-specific recombinase XerD
MRHAYASWLVQKGASLYEVQKLLGHSSIAVTQIYAHLAPSQLHETVNRIQLDLDSGVGGNDLPVLP